MPAPKWNKSSVDNIPQPERVFFALFEPISFSDVPGCFPCIILDDEIVVLNLDKEFGTKNKIVEEEHTLKLSAENREWYFGSLQYLPFWRYLNVDESEYWKESIEKFMIERNEDL